MAETATEGQQQVSLPVTTEATQSRGRDLAHFNVISQVTSDGRILIGQDMEIFPARELLEFARPGARAYDVRDRRFGGEQIALICDPACSPRVSMTTAYRNLKSPYIVRLLEAGVVDWLPENRQRFAFIFSKPVGSKILETPDARPVRIADEKMVDTIIKPVLSVLSELSNIDGVHGAINLENIFISGQTGQEMLMVGECLSSAPSFTQHPIYESASRAMAKPAGRGIGSLKDDLYALGVCIAMIARGENLMEGKTPEEIIQEKIDLGSYGAIIGRARIPGTVAEFLRGVLNDDESQRWDIDDAVHWLHGQRHPPKQPTTVTRAARALVFQEKKYTDLRILSAAFSTNPPLAAEEVETGEFRNWLKRNFTDKQLKLRVENVCENDGATTPERMIAGLCIALDPYAPVRYKGQSMFPAGMGTALTEAMVRGDDQKIYADMILQSLPNSWIVQRLDDMPQASELLSRFDRCRTALAQRAPGYGMERVLYLLNPEAPCMSASFSQSVVLSPGRLLLALEDLLKRGQQPPSMVLDRHMVAFISVREPRLIDQHLALFASPEKPRQTLAGMRTLAAIQRRFAIGPLPMVCNWLISLSGPVIETIHNRDLREDMKRHLSRMTGNGNLSSVIEVIDDHSLILDDARRFMLARHEYRDLQNEKREIETYLKKRRNFGRSTGRQVAMIVSCSLSIMAIMTYVIFKILGWA